MNILQNKLPSKVLIGGVEVLINTDFRTSITFEKLMKEYDLDEEDERKEFYDKALKLYYPILNEDFNKSDIQIKRLINHIADNYKEAINEFMWFYRCGKEINIEETERTTLKEEILNYEYDSDKLYAAFLDQYNMDLTEADLHWWKFKAMISGLKEDNEISKIMSIRATDLSQIKDKSLQEHYRKLKKIYKIPLPAEQVEEDNEVADILLNGGDLSQLKE